jgi:hypothetical protein
LVFLEKEGGARMRLFSALFWGIFFLASGAILLLKYMFNLQVSGGKLIFGLFVLMMGISLLTSNFGWYSYNDRNDNIIAFSSNQQVNVENSKEYTLIFGSTTYDVTDLEQGSHVKINCIFGSCKVKLPAGAIQVNADSAFGNVRLPNGTVTFGNLPYSTDGDNKTKIDIDCVFGSATVSD